MLEESEGPLRALLWMITPAGNPDVTRGGVCVREREIDRQTDINHTLYTLHAPACK